MAAASNRQLSKSFAAPIFLVAGNMLVEKRWQLLGGAFGSACPRQHPPEYPVLDDVMMVERCQGVAEGKDDDRPADLLVNFAQLVSQAAI